MICKIRYSDEYLSHHGILGQKWGVKNGPPYPLAKENYSSSEKKARYKYGATSGKAHNSSQKNQSLVETINKDSTKYALDALNTPDSAYTKDLSVYNLDPDFKRDVIRAAKILGFAAGTAACSLGIAYLAKNRDKVFKILEDPNTYLQLLEPGYNTSLSPKAYSLDKINKAYHGSLNSFVGTIAKSKNLDVITDIDDFSSLLQNPSDKSFLDPNNLIKDMRVNIIDASASRRLSCWSGSQAYFLSNLTGEKFASKSYENLVDFNDFGHLYKNAISKFDIHGTRVDDFVGKFGPIGERADNDTTFELVRSIMKNVTKDNNLTPDGTRTIGFINAGYYTTTCTHEWNFEVNWLENGLKELFMADSYTGERYRVARQVRDNDQIVTSVTGGMTKFIEELHHYGADSIRFYAPSLKDVDPKSMAEVVLKENIIKHGFYYGEYYGIYYSIVI